MSKGVTGRLDLRTDGALVSVYLHEGEIAAAEAEDDIPELVRRLASLGHLHAGRARYLARAHRNGAEVFGSLFDEVPETELVRVLHQRFRENLTIFVGAIQEPRFTPLSAVFADNLQFGLHSTREIEDCIRVWERAHSVDLELEVLPGAAPTTEPAWDRLREAALTGATVGELVKHSGLEPHAGRALVVDLLDAGVLLRADQVAASAPERTWREPTPPLFTRSATPPPFLRSPSGAATRGVPVSPEPTYTAPEPVVQRRPADLSEWLSRPPSPRRVATPTAPLSAPRTPPAPEASPEPKAAPPEPPDLSGWLTKTPSPARRVGPEPQQQAEPDMTGWFTGPRRPSGPVLLSVVRRQVGQSLMACVVRNPDGRVGARCGPLEQTFEDTTAALAERLAQGPLGPMGRYWLAQVDEQRLLVACCVREWHLACLVDATDPRIGPILGHGLPDAILQLFDEWEEARSPQPTSGEES